jgi:hypothetical protein
MTTSANDLPKWMRDRWQDVGERVCDGLRELDLEIHRDYWFQRLDRPAQHTIIELRDPEFLTPDLLVVCAKAAAAENGEWTIYITYIDRKADKLVGLAGTKAGFVWQHSDEPWILRAVRDTNIRLSGAALPKID